MNGKRAEGELMSLSEKVIAVEDSGLPVSIRQEDVFRVRIANVRRRHTLLGMAIGAGVGAVIGALSVKYDRGTAAAGIAVIGLGPGAAVGGALPIGVPLYEAPGGLKRKAP